MQLEETIESLMELGCVRVTFTVNPTKQCLVAAEQHVDCHASGTMIQHQCVAKTYAGAVMQLQRLAEHCNGLKSNIVGLS